MGKNQGSLCVVDASGDNEVTVAWGRGGLWEDKKEEVTCRNCLFHEGVMSCDCNGSPGRARYR